MPTTTGLHPSYAARITGIDIGQRPSPEEAAWVRDACSMKGLEEAEGRAWFERLMDFAGTPDFVHARRWRRGDVAAWDCAVMRRATPFARASERRHVALATAPCPPATH